jgi:hypothetical protein
MSTRKPKGRNIAVSPFRQLVTDLMHFSAQVPCVTMDRTMNLARLRAARQNCQIRPCWTAIFVKAFGIVSQRMPVFRRVYMPFPWPRFYEHPYSIATINVERKWNDEDVVFHAQIRRPETRSLGEIDTIVRYLKDEDVEKVGHFRRIMSMTKVPWPLRRFVWWAALNLFSRRRVHNFGTFGISTTAAQGAGILRLVPMLTSTLHYGMFDDNDGLQMRISFDHRVCDGATVASALLAMDNVLNDEILNELLSLRFARAA